MRQSIFFALLLLISNVKICHAQPEESSVLMTIGQEDISVNDFLNVYNKNLDLVLDKDQRDFDYYLNLFVNYKLKLAEAKALGYDKKESFIKELSTYESQLSNAYMTDNTISEALLKEAYHRTANEVKVQHILVRLLPNQDTLVAFNKISSIRPRLINEEFSSLKNELHDGTSIFVEDLGYFSAFKMVYDFENVAFSTPIDSVSKPFRTQFGFHILKVLDNRPSRGQVEVAHIMISNTQKDSSTIPEKRIAELHRLVSQGESFENLAKQFSDDKSTAMKGGLLRPFKSGEINSEVFIETAFAMSKIGEVSSPIQTQFGWHILKLIAKYPVDDFETLRPSLEQSIKRDSRSQIIRKNTIENLKKKYRILEPNIQNLEKTFVRNDSGWTLLKNILEPDFLTIENEVISYEDFLNHLNKIKKSVNNNLNVKEFLQQQYYTFLDEKLLDYKKNHLAEENPEYADVLQEYNDGLILFDLMQDKIWNGAKNDSIGLINYYQSNLNSYKSPEKILGTVVRSSQERALKRVQNMWRKKIDNQAISKKLNVKEQLIITSSGTFDKMDNLIPPDAILKVGISEIIPHDNGFVLLKITEILPESILPFEEVRGQVISDYQKKLETQWIGDLRQKFKVQINSDVLQNLKNTLNQ